MYEPIRVSGWQQLAEELLETLGDEVRDQGVPTWVRVFDDDDEESGFAVDASSEPQALLGWTAPPECVAVGVVATGRLRVDPSAAGGWSGDGRSFGDVYQDLAQIEGSRIRMCCVVGRSGDVGWHLEGPHGVRGTSAPEAGRLLDCLKRCLGLATPPPPEPAAELHAAAWIASVLEAAMESPRPLTWSDVTRLHPLARLLAGDLGGPTGGEDAEDGVEGDVEKPDELADMIRIAANAWSWPEIRAQAAGGNLEGLVDARMAAWMDDGMFARWLLSLVPPVEQLIGAVRAYLVPSAAARLENAVAPGV
ncbi:MAG TPA: hypothetical protein VNF71_00870 [Acidimicrobiales bacterium]|nr:hypothetical protein [Acidimicrobiales bacterium]